MDGRARACPPEDCGGAGAYQQILEALADPGKADEEWLDMVGDDFDPDVFDKTAVNKSLKAAFSARPSSGRAG